MVMLGLLKLKYDLNMLYNSVIEKDFLGLSLER